MSNADTIKRAAKALIEDPTGEHARSLLASLLTRQGTPILERVAAVLERIEHTADLPAGRYFQINSVGADGVWHSSPPFADDRPESIARISMTVEDLKRKYPERKWTASRRNIGDWSTPDTRFAPGAFSETLRENIGAQYHAWHENEDGNWTHAPTAPPAPVWHWSPDLYTHPDGTLDERIDAVNAARGVQPAGEASAEEREP
jgi:hypothetical protein